MKKIFILVLLTISLISYSQKLEKIKGNKNVISSERVFEDLKSIELNKNIDILLVKGDENKLEIYADDNLHDIVETNLNNGKLSISLTHKISTKKKFELTLHVEGPVLEQITLNDNSKLINEGYIDFEDLTLILNDKAVADVLFNTNSLILNLNDRSKGEMSFKGDDVIYNLQGNSKLKVDNNFENIIVKINEKSNITLTGKTNAIDIIAKNLAKVKASNLKANSTKIIAENNVNIYTYTTNDLTISAESRSKIYIYGNPEIKLESFKGTASLFKKE